MLSAHPMVDVGYDALNFFRYCYHRYDPITDPTQIRKLLDDTSYRLDHRFGIVLNPEQCLVDIGDKDLTYGHVYHTILKNIFREKGKPVVGDKEALAWTKIPDFLQMCPNGKAIVILRDPRDVVVSFKNMTIAPGNDYLIALFNVVDAVNHAFRFKQRYPNRVHIVGFERLKLHTESELRSLCDFLDLEYSENMLQNDGFTDRLGNEWDQTLAKTFVDEADWLAPVGRWKKIIDLEDLYLCQNIAHKQISMLGLQIDNRDFSRETFEAATKKLMETPLLVDAYKRWFESGEGMEIFPLDPLNPINWQPGDVQQPEAFNSDDYDSMGT